MTDSYLPKDLRPSENKDKPIDLYDGGEDFKIAYTPSPVAPYDRDLDIRTRALNAYSIRMMGRPIEDYRLTVELGLIDHYEKYLRGDNG